MHEMALVLKFVFFFFLKRVEDQDNRLFHEGVENKILKDTIVSGILIIEIQSEICFVFSLVHCFHFKALCQSTQKPHFYCFLFPRGFSLLFLGELVHHPLDQMITL